MGQLEGRTVYVMANDYTVKAGSMAEKLEAMKMQNEVGSLVAGRVARLHAREGQSVDTGQVLVELEA